MTIQYEECPACGRDDDGEELGRTQDALQLEQAAHGHRRICEDCCNPSQPGNGCPRWHVLAKKAKAAFERTIVAGL